MATLRIGILTVSDRAAAGDMEDRGGPAVAEALAPDWQVVKREIVPDERHRIAAVLSAWADSGQFDVIFTTGGTGLAPRDVTPQATEDVADRLIPGVAEAMRAAGLRQTAGSMLSRAVAASRGQVLIINLPGSPRGAAEGIDVVRPVLEHAAATLRGASHPGGATPPPEPRF